jgi:DNA-directed RNA polymerase specialized sigma24 family protein
MRLPASSCWHATAAALGQSESAVKSRHLRALQRLRGLLDEPREDQP